MSKKRLKNDHLAKLRQFQKGMDVEDYLSSQHRQVIRALEESYVIGDDLSPYATNDALNDALNSLASVLPIVSGAHGISTVGKFSAGSISFNQNYCPASAGSFNGTLFRPSKSGTYFVEFHFVIAADLNNSGINPIIDLSIRKEPATDVQTWYADKNSITLVLREDADQVDLGRSPYAWQSMYQIMNLTPTEGVSFYALTLSSGASLRRMMCKIYRIGD